MCKQRTIAAFTVLVQLCSPRANETEMSAALFTKNGEKRTLNCAQSLVTMYSWPFFCILKTTVSQLSDAIVTSVLSA